MAKDKTGHVLVRVLELSDVLNHIMQAQATASDLATIRDTVVLPQLVSKCRLHRNPQVGQKNCLNSRSNLVLSEMFLLTYSQLDFSPKTNNRF